MKLVIQIPCKNEETTLPIVIAEFPKHIEGIAIIEYQIIDDGSTDKTSMVAKELGVHHIIKHTQNKGLGIAFKEGIEHALEIGADILVNTDGDNQYPGQYISQLVAKIISGDADIVIGDRNPTVNKHFSLLKRILQKIGNAFVGHVAGIPMKDSVSGFRAYNKHALIELNITSKFSYVIDTIVQASRKGLKIEWLPIHTNPPTRDSRLFPNIFVHIKKTIINLMRVFIMYQPFKFFSYLSIPFLLVGIWTIVRFTYNYLVGEGSGKIQSLIIGSVATQIGLSFLVIAFMADLIAKNRFLLEENLKISKKMKYNV